MIPPARPDALAWAAQGSRAAAGALRFVAACITGFAGLLAIALSLAAVERAGASEPAQTSASAYLDFDLSVLRALADRSLRGKSGLQEIWMHRPDWQVREPDPGPLRLASLRDAWAAAASEKSRFRTAARGALDALPFLLCGLVLVFLAAASAGAIAGLRLASRLPLGIALVLVPLAPMLDPAIFYDRTRSLGTGLAGAAFVAAFAGALSGAASRALFAAHPQPSHLRALGGRKALFTAARLAALDAADWLVPLVPALAAAALFVCAKGDQDPARRGQSSGFGALIRSAMSEAFAGERLSSCALVAAGLLLLWFLGHRFVLEVRGALGARKALS
jgi:hypothetical protein